MQDLRYAARNLWRNRLFTVSAVLILAVGIAASTGLFAVVDAIVLHPLPYTGAERIARVRLLPPSGEPRPAVVTADEFRTLRGAATLDSVYIRDSFTKTLGGTSFPESVWTEYYTGDALPMLGVQPLIGRVFTEADAPLGKEPQRVAVLTHRFWQRHFAGQSSAIGQTLRLDNEPFTVIGVIPAEYALDLTDVILPLRMSRDAAATWPVLVRVREGLSMVAAESELQQAYEQFARTKRCDASRVNDQGGLQRRSRELEASCGGAGDDRCRVVGWNRCGDSCARRSVSRTCRLRPDTRHRRANLFADRELYDVVRARRPLSTSAI